MGIIHVLDAPKEKVTNKTSLNHTLRTILNDMRQGLGTSDTTLPAPPLRCLKPCLLNQPSQYVKMLIEFHTVVHIEILKGLSLFCVLLINRQINFPLPATPPPPRSSDKSFYIMQHIVISTVVSNDLTPPTHVFMYERFYHLNETKLEDEFNIRKKLENRGLYNNDNLMRKIKVKLNIPIILYLTFRNLSIFLGQKFTNMFSTYI